MLKVILECFKRYDVEYEENYSIKKNSKIKIGGIARYAITPNTEVKLINALKWLTGNGIPYKVVGAMSNILHCGDAFDGVLIKTDKIDTYCAAEDTVYASCGCYLPTLTRRLAAFGIGGFSELSSIPARLGGAVYGNAGAFGKSVSDVLIGAKLYDTEGGRVIYLDNSELELSYRDSVLKREGYILLSAKLFAKRGSSEEALLDIKRFSDIRRATQPSLPSLGSIFKRHDGVAVSALIDKAGLKGLRVGDAMVSTKHAGFIVNLGNATAAEVLELIELIKSRIRCIYGIELKEEIELL